MSQFVEGRQHRRRHTESRHPSGGVAGGRDRGGRRRGRGGARRSPGIAEVPAPRAARGVADRAPATSAIDRAGQALAVRADGRERVWSVGGVDRGEPRADDAGARAPHRAAPGLRPVRRAPGQPRDAAGADRDRRDRSGRGVLGRPVLHFRTLWAPILAHGLNNTIGLTAVYLVRPIYGWGSLPCSKTTASDPFEGAERRPHPDHQRGPRWSRSSRPSPGSAGSAGSHRRKSRCRRRTWPLRQSPLQDSDSGRDRNEMFTMRTGIRDDGIRSLIRALIARLGGFLADVGQRRRGRDRGRPPDGRAATRLQ